MKHKYKINIDQPVPSDAQIDRHKDFGRTLAAYHNLTQPIYRVPLYKNPKAFIGLVLIFTIAALVFCSAEGAGLPSATAGNACAGAFASSAVDLLM